MRSVLLAIRTSEEWASLLSEEPPPQVYVKLLTCAITRAVVLMGNWNYKWDVSVQWSFLSSPTLTYRPSDRRQIEAVTGAWNLLLPLLGYILARNYLRA